MNQSNWPSAAQTGIRPLVRGRRGPRVLMDVNGRDWVHPDIEAEGATAECDLEDWQPGWWRHSGAADFLSVHVLRDSGGTQREIGEEDRGEDSWDGQMLRGVRA